MLYKVPLILSPQPEGGFTVTSPLFPELVTEGDTASEALENVQDALAAVIETYQDLGRPLPAGTRGNHSGSDRFAAVAHTTGAEQLYLRAVEISTAAEQNRFGREQIRNAAEQRSTAAEWNCTAPAKNRSAADQNCTAPNKNRSAAE
ncbi:MAG: antitoxin HicB [Acidobacteriota bacterium]|jgi:antitoxin HicB|nr:antitoxin HicB [Acidobacteriota bacterium]